MSRSIDEPLDPKEEKPQIQNSELFDISMGIFYSLELIHAKADLIMEHLGIEIPENLKGTPEN